MMRVMITYTLIMCSSLSFILTYTVKGFSMQNHKHITCKFFMNLFQPLRKDCCGDIPLNSYAIVHFGVSYFLDHHVFSFINKLLFICLAAKCFVFFFKILPWVIFPHNENSALIIESTPNCQYLLLYTLLHLQP